MKRKKIIAAALSAVILLTSCTPIKNTLTGDDGKINNIDSSGRSSPIGNAEAEKYPVETPAISKTDFIVTAEAENAAISGNLYISEGREGFSGEGYVSGFTKEYGNSIKIAVDVPSSQHYDITLCVASDSNVKNSLAVNGKKVGEFEIEDYEESKFIKATFFGVYLEQGTSEISVTEIDGNIDLDYVEITNNKTIDEDINKISSDLCNENATQSTKDLMEYLVQNYGKKIITGQYSSSKKNKELELIYDVTEQYPAIRFGDMRGYSLNGHTDTKETEATIEWAKKGGIAGLMWYWNAPTGRASVYEASSDFDLSKAVTSMDIATLSQSDIKKLCDEGKISAECLAVIKDIDAVSEQLKILQENDVPVLWRPLHEAGGEWFWWGSAGSKSYQWLWGLLYSRMTFYHKLNNLIWIWNGQDKNYTVSKNMYDIASMDIYLSGETDFGSRVEQYQWLKKMTDSQKMLAVSECGLVPNVDNLFRDKSVWSFFGLWYGDYIMTSDGKFSEAYNTAEQLKKIYNSEGSINLYKYINRNNAVNEK